MNELFNKLLTLIRGDVVILQQQIQKLFTRQIDETSSLKSEFANLAKEIKAQKSPVVNVPAPNVRVNVPNVIVPEIKIPDVNLPAIKVPKPEVTVNIPPIKFPKPEKPIINIEPKIDVKIPKEMTVEGFKEFARQVLALLQQDAQDEFTQYDHLNPMPVLLVDKDGKAYRAGGGMVSVSGGGNSSNDPLEQFKISDADETGTTKYYGFVDRDGHWYILKNDTTANNYRYAAGPAGYATNWANRASLTYDYFNRVFKQ